MLLIAGGYEGGLVGLDVPQIDEALGFDSSSIHSEQVTLAFRFLCSQGSIRCLALGSDFLCCGGSDETVQIYGLRHRKKHGDLMLSDGCITAIGAVGSISNGLILVANEHGALDVYSSRHLGHLKQLKGHKAPVTSISIHPNGELALSVSEDFTLRLWDVKTFMCVFYSRLKEPIIGAEWHGDGKTYYILLESQLLIFSLSEDVKPQLYKAEGGQKHTCASWFGTYVAVGCRSGSVVLYPVVPGIPVCSGKLHTKRIKGIVGMSGCIVTVDSDGILVFLKVTDNNGVVFSELFRYGVEMRVNVLICKPD
ncbi:WD domain G-beta repeat family protein [Babesia bovis T2Bo]|uniref:WD domain, G-beta repeat containing protein n=1 Tax=Babesia bovis TaxID=5865 RepID=A7AN05_BABBO|nr:WD domain G-beta repeat family protein [Babesia bovis T2Bo]EDO07939.1 WD domain G-beta repeat family protein [Babesia bovis T2Bo]|eukprot:XP_001611507.1 WD domain, G-beta repeat containing protein [Babesia bovis T2Bo]